MAVKHRHDAAPRVVLLTSPGLFGAEIINRLAVDDGINLIGIGLTDRLYKGKGLISSVHTFRQRTGWRYLAYNALHSHLAWMCLRMTGRPAGLKRVAGEVRRLKDVNSPSTTDWLRDLRPDYLASYFFNQWIGPAARAVPTRDAVNMHPSLLPALRGPDPVFRAIERGLPTTGYTIHRIANDMDQGQILYQEQCLLPPGLSAFALYLKAIREGSDLLARWLAGALPAKPHFASSPQAGDYTTFPTPRDVGDFLKAGHRLIGLHELKAALANVR